MDNEQLANWGEEYLADEDDDSTPREDSFHDAEGNSSPDNCQGPGLLRNIIDDNRTFLNEHPKRPDRTEDQKNRRSARLLQNECPDYRLMHGIRKYVKQNPTN